MGTGILLILIAALFGGRRPNGNGNGPGPIIGKKAVEPDYQPGPVILEPMPVVPPDDDDDDAQWLAQVAQLISDTPKPGRFYQIRQGDTMSAIAGEALGASNKGSNRVALIKCCTRVPWNRELYVSNRYAQSWGTMFNVDGENLSASFLPRNASAPQALASRTMPERTIDGSGNYTTGQTGYYGLLWIPTFAASNLGVNCQPNDPPAWLMGALA
jgi:hypothetical protein